ncbi:MAG: protein kinase [Deltaproteobacteria bacterium]|nr:protein kinase [Deltaproteobacteria bacterium]
MTAEGTDPSQDDTLAAGPATPAAPTPDTPPLRDRGGRYRPGAVIGRGGMGEVCAAVDGDIGRDVAIKRLRHKDAPPEAVARFLREARIQARLEHPAIVPVHDLGTDGDGAPFFAMKRLAGTTLAAVLDGKDPALAAKFPRPRLLRAFVDVCLAVEFAHTRGVVHRDLKPANVMLGDFGEVYVLDWGIARVVGDRDDAVAIGAQIDTLDPATAPTAAPRDPSTRAGAVLGTPGYMAPEQLRGEPIDHRADVYALGCVLFEILADAPLHERPAAIASTLAGADARPGARGAECPPELEAACVQATAADAGDRFATARELGEFVQRFLDGDRDLQRRRTLAAEHAATARTAQATGDRATAMREAGRALAIDPTSEVAARIISQLMLAPPREVPPEVHARMAQLDLEQSRRQSFIGVAAFAAYFLFLPVFMIQGVRDWSWLILTYGIALVGVAHAWWMGRAAVPTVAGITVGLFLNTAIVIAFSRVLGPYLVVGAIGTGVIASIATYPLLLPRYPLVYGVISTIIWLPPLCEHLGVFAPTTAWTDGQVVVHSAVVQIRSYGDLEMIAFGLLLFLFAGLFARRIALGQRRAQEQLELQAWHLRQLVPST